MDRDGDEDLFRISAEAGASLVFQVDAEKYGSVLDSSLALLDTAGKVLASNDDAKWPGRALNRDAMINFKFKDKGDYFVKVSSLYRRGGPDHVLPPHRSAGGARLHAISQHRSTLRAAWRKR